MKCWILSSDSEIASTKRLVGALTCSKFETEVLNPVELHFEFGHRGASLFNKGQAVADWPEMVWARLGWQTLEHGLRLCQFLESSQIPVLNSSQSLREASDKLLSLQLLYQAGLPLPQTRFAAPTLATENHLFPGQSSHVFKTLQGSQGFGVTWQTERAQSQAAVDSFRNLQAPVIVQELVTDSYGRDVRALVAGGEVLGAIERQSRGDDLRSNLHQGGRAQKTELSDLETKLALQSCEALGLFYAGVDFLRTKDGPLFLEVNPSPGFEGISQTLGFDLAEAVVSLSLR